MVVHSRFTTKTKVRAMKTAQAMLVTSIQAQKSPGKGSKSDEPTSTTSSFQGSKRSRQSALTEELPGWPEGTSAESQETVELPLDVETRGVPMETPKITLILTSMVMMMFQCADVAVVALPMLIVSVGCNRNSASSVNPILSAEGS